MLQAMRSRAAGVFAKILMGLLVLSFALWGIGDVFRSATRDVTVASIGSTKISQQELSREVSRRSEDLARKLGSRYDPALIKALHLDVQILNSMIDEVLINREARAQGIIVGDDAVGEEVRSNPAFQVDGKFNLSRFQALLHNARIGEQQFYNDIRTRTAAKLLLSALSGLSYPDALAPLLAAYNAEQRAGTYMLLTPASVKQVPEPSDKELTNYYTATKSRYTVPEYRTVSYALIDFAGVAKTATVSQDDLKAAYDERAASLRKPETRAVEQLLYDSEDKAKQAHSMLAVAKDDHFESMARLVPAVNEDKVQIGTLPKSQLPKEAADTVFGLKQNELSPIIKTDFGWHIFRVTKIIPGHTPTLDEVRPALEKELQRHAAEEAVTRTVNQVEDALAGGAKLADAVKPLGAEVVKAGPVSKEGLSPDGKKIAGLPGTKPFLDMAFATDEKTESQATPTEDGSYFIIRVENVTPERVKTPDEIKPDLVRSWQNEKRGEMLADMAP